MKLVQALAGACSLVTIQGVSRAQVADYPPRKIIQSSTYVQSFRRATTTQQQASGDIELFDQVTTVNVKQLASDIPLTITDSFARSGQSASTEFTINNFFPPSIDSSQGSSDALRTTESVPLVVGSISTSLTPKASVQPTAPVQASFTATTASSFGAYATSDSPGFVDSFQNKVLNKAFLRGN